MKTHIILASVVAFAVSACSSGKGTSTNSINAAGNPPAVANPAKDNSQAKNQTLNAGEHPVHGSATPSSDLWKGYFIAPNACAFSILEIKDDSDGKRTFVGSIEESPEKPLCEDSVYLFKCEGAACSDSYGHVFNIIDKDHFGLADPISGEKWQYSRYDYAGPPEEKFIDICARGEIGKALASEVHASSCASVSSSKLAQLKSFAVHLGGESPVPPGAFLGLSGLKFLRFESSHTFKLESGVFEGMPALEELHISNNPNLQTLGEGVFAGLSSLKSLYFENDQGGFPDLYLPPDLFLWTPSLEVLHIDGFWIDKIYAKTFQGLSALTELQIFAAVGAYEANSFLGLSSLKQLGIARIVSSNSSHLLTPLDLPPGVFNGLTSLKTLWMGDLGGLLAIRPGVFRGLPSLWGLTIDPASELPYGAFMELSKLTDLMINSPGSGSHSRGPVPALSIIQPGAFDGLSNLHRLSFQGNRVEQIPPSTFEGLTKLEDLKLQGNPIANGRVSCVSLGLAAASHRGGNYFCGGVKVDAETY